VKFQFPLGIVIGSEQKGIRDVIRKHIDIAVTIPMANARMSFNAAHATTILCYEISRHRKTTKPVRTSKPIGYKYEEEPEPEES